MDVITMEATAYKELIRKIEKIADYVFKKESKPNEEEGKHSASCVFFFPLFLPTFVASL